MTDGDVENTVPWIERMRVRHPYAYERNLYWLKANVFAYPYAFLIDPGGVIVWRGHPGKLDEALIEKHLEGALTRPLYAWPEAFAEVKALALEEKWPEAVQLAEKLTTENEELAVYRDAVNQLLRTRVKSLVTLVRSGDYYSAWNRAQALKEALGDHPAVFEIDLAIRALERDPKLHAIWNAQKEIVALRARAVSSREEAEAAIAELEEIAKRYPEQLLAREAELGVGTLRRKIEAWFE